MLTLVQASFAVLSTRAAWSFDNLSRQVTSAHIVLVIAVRDTGVLVWTHLYNMLVTINSDITCESQSDAPGWRRHHVLIRS